jgi:aspartate carbamoyltransferase catalytic subunit
MQADAIVIRHGQSGAPQVIAKHVKARVINAGDGRHEHPTQALLDMLTMRQRFGRLEGLQVAIVGDITHSRVARSNLIGLKTMGAETRVFGPNTLMPRELAEVYGTTVCTSLRECLEGAHVVMTLRLQKERMTSGLLPELREYSRVYGLNSERMKLARPDAIVMHPGPVNRGIEISPELMDGPQSVILDQVENGVAVRAALLFLILGGDE